MSRFFDLLHRLKEEAGNRSLHSGGIASGDDQKAGFELDQTLSILLPQDPNHQETSDSGCAAGDKVSVLQESGASHLKDFETNAEFRKVLLEDVRTRVENRIVSKSDSKSPGADRFRFLRMRLQELSGATNLKKLLITSPLPEDGKSTVALNLATSLAEGGKRSVLLIEADLHRSPLIEQLGLSARPGLAECLEDGANPITSLRHLKSLGWYLLAAGAARTNPTELLQGDALSGVMDKLAPFFDWILIDSPPIIPLNDALSLRRHANASILVVRAGRTPKEDVETASLLLEKQHLIGIVLNGVESLNAMYSRYSSYYGNGNGQATRPPRQ
jgi:capsular exopolysaccharide synthesis family protein